MRVTNNITSNNFINYIHNQSESLLKAQKTIASQKRINKISDDPVGISQVFGHRTRLAVIDQFQENINQGITRLEFNELTLESASELVNTARRVAESNVASGITAEDRQLAAEQVKDLYDQIMQLANSKFEDNFIFSGHATDTAPFSRDAGYTATYNGDDGTIRVMIAENVEVTIDADGRNTFENAAGGGVNIFDELKNLIDGLENSDLVAGSAQIQATIDPLFNGREQIEDTRADYASDFYRLQATGDYLTNLKPKVQDAVATLEDADLPTAIVELQSLETAYETTLATAARIIQPTLLNFLR